MRHGRIVPVAIGDPGQEKWETIFLALTTEGFYIGPFDRTPTTVAECKFYVKTARDTIKSGVFRKQVRGW